MSFNLSTKSKARASALDLRPADTQGFALLWWLSAEEAVFTAPNQPPSIAIGQNIGAKLCVCLRSPGLCLRCHNYGMQRHSRGGRPKEPRGAPAAFYDDDNVTVSTRRSRVPDDNTKDRRRVPE